MQRVGSNAGFALVITVTLMVLLALLSIALLSLASINLRAAGQGNAVAVARSNARMALVIAIGELQKSLGPDRAITANAEVLQANPGKPNVTGVWESWDMDLNNAPSYESEKASRFKRWLVSSDDATGVSDQQFIHAGWNGKTVEMVGNGSLGAGATEQEKARAGLIPVLGHAGQSATGAFAWHVSDESQKARIGSYRDPSQNDTLAKRGALLAGHRPDISVMQSPRGTKLDFLPTDATLQNYRDAVKAGEKFTSLDQVDLLTSGSPTIKPFRNEVTPYSLGVLADARLGGLKKDLSSLFELTTRSGSSAVLPPEYRGRRLFESTGPITGQADPYWSALSSYYNTFRGISKPDTDPVFNERPLGNVQLESVTPQTDYFPGPVIAKVEALFSYVTRDFHSNWKDSTFPNIDKKIKYLCHMIYMPVITLHNPYNVSISFDSLQVTVSNMPVGFLFYVNGVPQNRQLVPLTEMYYTDGTRRQKDFVMDIANWRSTASNTTTGAIVMKPGQTLQCYPYLDPNYTWTNVFDYENNKTGVSGAIKMKPGFVGRCVGFDVDWITPTHSPYGGVTQSDGNQGVMGLRDNEQISVDFGVIPQAHGMKDEFQVRAKITSQRRSYDYGGLRFFFGDEKNLKKIFPEVHHYPQGFVTTSNSTYVPTNDKISVHANAQSFALFSAYARTTRGGVYETDQRKAAQGGANILRDGRLAGMPIRFFNPALPVMSMDVRQGKPGAQSFEVNVQPFRNLGEVEDYFNIDQTNRTPILTGYTPNRGIKTGSYLELPLGPMQTIADFRRSNALATTYIPAFGQPVGNSFVSPMMSTDKVVQSNPSMAPYPMMDQSVLANNALYDSFYFSTFATEGDATPEDLFVAFQNHERSLPSQAFEPYLPPGETVGMAKGELFNSGPPKEDAYRQAAKYQLVRGAFNVNSTNVQAWKAKLAALSGAEISVLWGKSGKIETQQSNHYPIMPMSLVNTGDAAGGQVDPAKVDDLRSNQWSGYRELGPKELQDLAENIVAQVRKRGPFLSLSEFVNRRIGANSELTRMGALENAIQDSGINAGIFTDQIPVTVADLADANLYGYSTPEVMAGNPAAGAPGWISQGDLLRLLEPAITVRADTFVIRACGEAWDAGGGVLARAYCEAVVQRLPEYADPVDAPEVNVYTEGGAAATNKKFGRKLAMTSFRWLTDKEI